MADRLIHNRVFKVSKELNRLDLLCEQHRRQIGHREGLPDWERPKTPAGKASSRHERTPAFFAWNEEHENVEQRPQPAWQTQTPQKVARTLDMTMARERDNDRQPIPERSPFGNGSEDARDNAIVLSSSERHHEDEGMDDDSGINVDSDERLTEEDQPVVTGRSIAVSPMREDILDRVQPAAAAAPISSRESTPLPTVETPLLSYRSSSSPRYIHGRRLQASDAAVPRPRAQQFAAGVTTEQADRYRMSGSSGKRFRSPAKPTSLWNDLCNTYIHQSGPTNSSRNTTSFSHKRMARADAERRGSGTSAVNMDTYGWSGSESTRGQHRPVATGLEAMNVANQAAREFLNEPEEESKYSEPPMQARQCSDNVCPSVEIPGDASTTASRTGSNRQSKRVSFGGEITQPQPRTLPVLADKTTQTEDVYLEARTQSRTIPHDAEKRGSGSPVRCPACDTVVNESGRRRKVPRSSTNFDAATTASQRNFRRTNSHLINPIMINPRYPPEPTTFQGISTYSSVFNDRLAWR